ncbi:2-keto-4-pentenoate hydratase [Psychromonas sp. psych-6C06]|uniref:fumarylacetoacetate hydrolase family protein n=1 Tax=Psychromonas sp. psych-6C06 TaxID=2058089 RepID=UPI000C345AD0|nr:fumarylacetoacetate hydrolase family protein [Psychromonas sp. psych-6C06]PKF63685.1 2-keto-4-pentenoate hydratase [Psychromonas sp. psych-6C06]
MNKIQIEEKSIYPSKVVCIGRNYVEHIVELDNEIPEQMVFFIKPNSAISDVIISNVEEPIHYEAEISFVITDNKISAVGVGLDMTKRGIQSALKNKGLPWERAKAFDNSAVFSPFIPFTGDVTSLSMRLFINDLETQHANYPLMINKPEEIIDEVGTFMRFEDGDILMTGTPKGVGVAHKGDRFKGQVFYNDKLLLEQHWTVL